MVSKTEYGYIRSHSLEEEMRSSYLDYAMSVIVSRALPDVRDGLKPVQRRILYAAHEMGLRPNSSYRKSARLVGDVLGKYHPHGDGAVYDAAVRMAQDFSMRVPLIDGQGNFGSVDNDPPAAMRYTELKLSSAADELLDNLEQETVDFVDNFDASLQMPNVLPARLPNLLVNGAAGIAVGMATNIPPHNPSEICDGITKLIDRPMTTAEELLEIIPGPDFPTGAVIMGRDGSKDAYTTGRGQIIVRGVAEIEQMRRSSRMQIAVTELPYQVNKAALIEKIALLVKNRRLEGITEIRDESDRRGMRIVMELRGGAQGMVILNNLYKLTELQKSFSANMLALVDGKPEAVTVRSALIHYINFRREIIVRRSEYELRRARERAHILEGLRIALNNIDEIIRLIRAADDVETARTQLMNTFALDQPQAQAILDMQLRRLAALEQEKIETEFKELQAKIAELQDLINDPHKVDLVIKKETRGLKKKVGDERRTQISDDVLEINRDDIEAHEQIVVTLSQGGYIKRIAASTFRNQHRGGKGVSGMRLGDDDPIKNVIVVDTHDRLLFFTNTGRVLSVKAYELRPDLSRNTRGVPVQNIIPISDTERVESIIGVPKLDIPDVYLVMATRQGSIKRTALSHIANIRRAGLIIFNLRDKDSLVTARLADETQDIMMVTREGKSIRFPVTDVTTRQRAAGGVRGISLQDKKDHVVSMDIVIPDSKILVISDHGYGKLTYLKSYRTQGRGGSGIKTMSITRKTGKVAAAEIIGDSDEVYLVSKKAQIIRTNLAEIRAIGRATQGVRVFKPKTGDTVVSISCVSEFEVPEEKITGDANNNGTQNGMTKLI